MTEEGKELSNPFSTGSGGARFEANVQATFVTLMLSGGYAPCLPNWPIVQIKLQGKVAGYATDDLIVSVEHPSSGERRHLLGQVKHSISITAKDKIFGEVIQAAWSDFKNADVFKTGVDVIALITGPISAADTDGVNGLLDQARHTLDVSEFFTQVSRAKFCSDKIREKLVAFRTQLKKANGDEDVPDVELFEFLKSFHLLGYDLDRKGSVVSSLLQSHIAQFNKEIPDKIWYQIITEVQEFNQTAGTITPQTLSIDLLEHFKEPKLTYMPKDFAKEQTTSLVIALPTDWNLHPLSKSLALVNLLGSWNEKQETDKNIITQIVGESYGDWIVSIREILQYSDCPLDFNDGVWRVKNRIELWEALGGRIFDDHLSKLKTVAVEVLSVNDPAFELPANERYASAIHGKVLPHSKMLRKGLAETLALIGSKPNCLKNCSLGKADSTALVAVREILANTNWVLWGSLNSLLPIIAEASPAEFLSAVEHSLSAIPSPFDRLFEQEDTGVFGRNYIAGLLWALESIAWDELYLTRAAIALADLASHDPGGNWSNRPINSLTEIFLPWLPNTLASIEKRQAALKTVCVEQPDVGWKLLMNLLPDQHPTSSGTHKPEWRGIITEEWENVVTNDEYWRQSRFCAGLIVEQAGFDLKKLTSLTKNFDHLPSPASEVLKEKLASNHVINSAENDRMPLWSTLKKLIGHHRRYPNADWSLDDESLLPLEEIADLLAPTSPSLLHRRLFSEVDRYLYEGDGDWQAQQDKLFNLRTSAVKEIFAAGGLQLVLDFMSSVENSQLVGDSLATMNRQEFDSELLPHLLDMDNHKQWLFISSYAWRRRHMGGWLWFDEIDKSAWEPKQIASLLCVLPFEKNAWDRVSILLADNDGEYWKKINANAYQSNDPIDFAAEKLIEFGRPGAAIQCFMTDIFQKKKINTDLACNALLALVTIEEPYGQVDSYSIIEVIKELQDSPETDQEKLFQVEWAYVPLLDHDGGASPKTLENRLASDPEFFRELIQLAYRSTDEDEVEEPSEFRRNLADNSYRLLSTWETIPGVQENGDFDVTAFEAWLNRVEDIFIGSGRYDVAMLTLGNVLVNSPSEPNGLWIHPAIAIALNHKKRSSLRSGYFTGIRNSRGVHWVDPEAKAELELAEKYRKQAEDVENAGYSRLATTLREVADSYDRDAERILKGRDLNI